MTCQAQVTRTAFRVVCDDCDPHLIDTASFRWDANSRAHSHMNATDGEHHVNVFGGTWQVDCDSPGPFWSAFAAYPLDGPDPHSAHPTLARYPMPQVRSVCAHHLAESMAADLDGFGSTRMWVVTPAERDER